MLEQPTGFGSGSLFDAEVVRAEALPFELPAGRYLSEAMLGMYGSPPNTGSGREDDKKQASPNWRRLRRALGTGPAQGVCSAVAWIAIGVLFGTVSPEATAVLREQLSRDWFLLLGELGPKGRDWLLDALPHVLAQAIYRVLVDAFPPEHLQMVQHAEKILHKLGVVIQHEVSGFHLNGETSRECRRKLFKRPVIEHPHLDLVEAMRAELRHQQLKSQNAEGRPLEFGNIKTGKALEELQLDHVLELRARAATGHGAAIGLGGAAALPPLCPPELSVDRYADISSRGEELFMQHLVNLNPEAAEDDEDEDEAEGEEAAEVPQPISPLSPVGTRRTHQRSSWGHRSQRDREQEAADRRRRDDLLASKIAAPLPEAYQKRSLDTSVVSPLLDRLAPGAQALQPSEAQQLRMDPPSEAFLPRLTAATPARASGGEPGSQQPCATRRRHSGTVLSGCGSTVVLSASGKAQAQKTLPKLPEGSLELDFPPLRIKREAVKQRLEQDLEACHRASFEQYKRDYDLQTGQKKSRLDGERLGREEAIFVHKLQALVGSRSTPALRPLGPEGAPRSDLAVRGASTTGFAAGGFGGSRRAGATAGGRRVWNELTGLDGPPLRR